MLNDDWKPSETSGTPLYKQIAQFIKEKISSGEWTIGTKLPTQREFAEILEVNRSTVITALEDLKAEGLIEGKNSGGTVVVNNTWSLLNNSRTPKWEGYIERGIYKPNLSTIQMINKLEFKNGIIRLGTGEVSPSLYPKQAMKKILHKVSNNLESMGYEQPKGSIKLRRAISEYVKKFGIKTSPEAVLIVSGSLQALQLLSMGILPKASTIITEKPSYLKSLHIFQSEGMKLKGIGMDENGINVNELRNSINKSTKLLYTIPTFHNPTGILQTEERRDEVLNLCREKRLPIIEDDAYRELWLEEKPPMPLKSKDKDGMVLYIGTVSKCLAAGMRIGWIVGPEAVINRLADIKMQADYGSSSLSQAVLSEFIESGLYEKYIEKLRNNLVVRRNITIEILEKYFKHIAQWNVPKGGFYIWLKLKKYISIDLLFKMCCEEGILINPGSIYDFAKNSNIRISYSYADIKELESALKRLSEIVIEITART